MSEKYIVSARKYRPSTFSSVVGQSALTTTLKNAISSGRLGQAYLFCGPRGVGKTSCARIFAKTINCTNRTPDGEACGECASCRDFASGASYNVIELDAASNNGVDHIRDLTEQVNVPPQVGNYRVFIIDEVHMLSPAAFNAFLKTLEEPPSYAIFILATTEKNKVLPTILSRCQIFDFHRITNSDIVEHLKGVASAEGIATEELALDVIAQKSDGAMRDALSIFDQVTAASGGNVTYEAALENLNVLDYDYFFRFVDFFRAGEVSESLLLFKEVRDKGFDAHFFLNGLATHVRNLMVGLVPQSLPLLEVSASVRDRYLEQARSLPASWYYKALKLLSDCDLNYRVSSNKQLLVELLLIELCQILQPQTVTAAAEGMKPIAKSTIKDSPAPKTEGTTRSDTKVTPKAVNGSSTTSSPSPHIPSAKPSPAPMSRPAATATARPANRMGVPSLSSLRHKAKSDGDSSEEDPGAPTRAKSFSDEDFLTAWKDFCEANRKQKIMVNAMRSGLPKRVSGASYTLEVPNQVVAAEFEGKIPGLLAFLRDRLENDLVTIEITVSSRPVSSRSMSDADKLKSLIENNISVAPFLKDIEGELI